MRTMLYLLYISALIAKLAQPGGAAIPEPVEKIKPVIPIKAQSFSLRDVRLLDGPFKHAMELDHRYLLSLDTDRLLHNFRINAGLPSTAKPLGGWEAPNVELRGHFVGHYLSACAKMYAGTGDEKLKQNASHVVAELAKCQEKLGNGYLSAYPETFIDRVEARQRVWAPWYTLHKIYAGLLDVYLLCDNKQALEVAEKMAQWAKRRTDKLTDEQMQAMLGTEHGGMNETLANLFAVTGNKDYLALSRRFNHHAVLDPLARREDHLTGLHANTQIPKIIGAAREYELTGDETMRTSASYFWEVVTKERSYVIGGHSDGESFSPKEHLSRYLSANTTETCNTYNMLKLTEHLFQWDPKAEYADYYERALYNHILASQNPETGMTCYYVPLRSGSRKVFSTPNGSFWCCTGTGVENHAQYGEGIYFHDSKGLFLNLFIASELQWKAKGIKLRQETQFPEADSTRVVFSCDRPVELALRVRHPSWVSSGFRIMLNGKPISDSSSPSSYATISRTWKNGDTLEISLPMTLRTEAFNDDPHRLAFLYGPIVLCGNVAPGSPAPDIVSSSGHVVDAIAPVSGKPLCFTGSSNRFCAPGQESGTDVALTPFYRMSDRNYAVYFDVLSPEQFKAKEEAQAQEIARRKEIASRLVDEVIPGDRRSERGHKFAGETTYDGDFGDRHYRDSRDGGWFSYEMKILPNAPMELVCTYWGSDVGREFDILVNGTKIVTQQLTNLHPGQFFEQSYQIPAELLDGKERIIIRFQAHPNRMAGGVFGLMVLKKR